MGVAFDPPDLIESAAAEERWTDTERRHVGRILSDAFEETFKVKLVQRTSIGLIAYDSEVVSFASELFKETEKPTIDALEALSRQLLRLKTEQAR